MKTKTSTSTRLELPDTCITRPVTDVLTKFIMFFFSLLLDTGKYTRGCAPSYNDANNLTPWDDGYATKNRCKTMDGVEQCTCKLDYCNAGISQQAPLVAIIVASLAVYFSA